MRYNIHINKHKDYQKHVEHRLYSFFKQNIEKDDNSVITHKEMEVQYNPVFRGMLHIGYNNNNEVEITKSAQCLYKYST